MKTSNNSNYLPNVKTRYIRNKFTLMLFTTFYSSIVLTSILSCSTSRYKVDQELKEHFSKWYESLSCANWNKDQNQNYINYHCESEQQAIGLYSWCSGTFWNEYLHAQLEPKNVKLKLKNNFLDSSQALEIRGEDYKFIDSALNKAHYPRNDIVWHGVEYQEIEFWEQLKTLIKETKNGYDYSQVVGQTIQSYGFISSTLNKEYAVNFFDWKPQYDWPSPNLGKQPLKEKVAFKINIKKGYQGAAYLANFDFAGFGEGSEEDQVLIKRNSKFLIKNVWKEKDVNIFEVDLI